MTDDLEVFVVTGRPGENALRHVPFDEAEKRAVAEFNKWRNTDDPAYYAQSVDELCGRILRAALGEGTE